MYCPTRPKTEFDKLKHMVSRLLRIRCVHHLQHSAQLEDSARDLTGGPMHNGGENNKSCGGRIVALLTCR
jgi:hypothetical protein